MKFVFINIDKKVFLGERNINPIETFQLKDRKFYIFDKNIWFDAESNTVRTSKYDDGFVQIWVYMGYLELTKVKSCHINEIESFKSYLSEDSVQETLENVISEWSKISEDIDSHNKRIDIEISERENERQAKREQKKRLEKERFDKYILESEKNFINGQKIKSDALEELLKKCQINVPIRTLGWIRNNLIQISANGELDFCGSKSSGKIHYLIRELKDCLVK